MLPMMASLTPTHKTLPSPSRHRPYRAHRRRTHHPSPPPTAATMGITKGLKSFRKSLTKGSPKGGAPNGVRGIDDAIVPTRAGLGMSRSMDSLDALAAAPPLKQGLPVPEADWDIGELLADASDRTDEGDDGVDAEMAARMARAAVRRESMESNGSGGPGGGGPDPEFRALLAKPAAATPGAAPSAPPTPPRVAPRPKMTGSVRRATLQEGGPRGPIRRATTTIASPNVTSSFNAANLAPIVPTPPPAPQVRVSSSSVAGGGPRPRGT